MVSAKVGWMPTQSSSCVCQLDQNESKLICHAWLVKIKSFVCWGVGGVGRGGDQNAMILLAPP